MLTSEQLSQLWHQHAAALLLVARGHCAGFGATAAEDCVQEAFVRLATQEPQPHEPAGWLMRTVRNAAIDMTRSQIRRRNRETYFTANRPEWFEPVDPTSFEALPTDQLSRALTQLDSVTRDVVIGHVWNKLTFRQIAEAMDLSAATAHRRYESGLERLRQLMTSHSTTYSAHTGNHE